MLGKLMKYELRATARIMAPTFLGLLIFSFVGRFSLAQQLVSERSPNNALQDMLDMVATASMVMYTLAILAVTVVVFVMTIQRFYKNLTGDEGYLMHTLPVKPVELIWSKLLVATVWQFLSVAGIFVSVFILLSQGEVGTAMAEAFRMMWAEISGYLSWVWIPLMVVAAIASMFSNILMIYTSIALGHTFKNHKVLGAILSYFGLNMVTQALASPFTVLIVNPFTGMNYMSHAEVITATQTMARNSILFGMVLSLVTVVAYTLVTKYIFTKQLNLE